MGLIEWIIGIPILLILAVFLVWGAVIFPIGLLVETIREKQGADGVIEDAKRIYTYPTRPSRPKHRKS